MKTKRSTLIGLLSTLLVIVTVLSSVLVFTATADSTEPETSPDHLVYASSKDELLEKNPVQPWTLSDDTWQTVDPEASGIGLAWLFIDMTVVGDYDLVAFGINGETTKNLLDYAFLEKLPTEAGEAVAYAGSGYNKFETSDKYDGLITGKLYYDEIPEGTKYIGICATNWGTRVTPIKLIFDRTDKNLKDETLTSYHYPMSAVRPALMGVNDSGECFFETNTSYAGGTNVAIIPLEGTVFETLTFTAGNGKSSVDYAFVTEMIHRYDTIVTVDGTNVMQTADDGETVAIPDGAKYLLVRHTSAGSAIGPAAISFTNTDPATDYRIEISSVGARLNANSGLRVTTRIPTADLADIDYTVGTLIYPTDALVGALTVDTEGALNIEMTRGVAGNEYTYFTAAMTDIIAQNYAREFTAVSYIKVDGEYYYTAATSSSVYEAAIATYKENQNDAYADAVRAYIDGVVVIENGKQVMPYDGYEHPMTVTLSKYGTYATISGDDLTADSLKTVILDGEVYTRGWTFANGEFTISVGAEYSYPMNELEPVEGAIPPIKRNNADQIYTDEDGAKIVFIDLEALGYDYNKLFMKLSQVDNGWTAIWFLTEKPTKKGEPVSYAGNQTDRIVCGGGKNDKGKIVEKNIPADAKILAIYYSDPGYVFCPDELVFVGGNRLNAN